MRVSEKWYATKSLTDQVILIWGQHVSLDVRCNIPGARVGLLY